MKTLLLAAALALCLPALHSQSADEVEKRIVNLPPDQQAYERFRFWLTMLPPEQRTGDITERYRSYLKSRGFSEADAGAQIKSVEAQGARSEIERWNRILTAE